MKRCFVDWSGTLVDWTAAVCKLKGIPLSSDYVYSPKNISTYPFPLNRWDWVKWYLKEKLGAYNVEGRAEVFLEGLGETFYAQLPWMFDGKVLLEELERIFSSDLYIVTNPIYTPGSVEGTIRWIRRETPHLQSKLIVCYPNKAVLASPDTILIDDKNENVADFADAGGQAVLMPRLWNADYELATQPIKAIERVLDVCRDFVNRKERN